MAFTSTTVSGVTLSLSGTAILNDPNDAERNNFDTKTSATGNENGHYRIEWDIVAGGG